MKIPGSFLQSDVVVALSIPMPAGQGGSGITFPLVEGRILEIHEDCVIIQTAKGDTMCIPDSRIQHLIKPSAILRPENGLVGANGERI